MIKANAQKRATAQKGCDIWSLKNYQGMKR